jgi:hypothetical protein
VARLVGMDELAERFDEAIEREHEHLERVRS